MFIQYLPIYIIMVQNYKYNTFELRDRYRVVQPDYFDNYYC